MGQYGKVKMAIFRKGVPKWEEDGCGNLKLTHLEQEWQPKIDPSEEASGNGDIRQGIKVPEVKGA